MARRRRRLLLAASAILVVLGLAATGFASINLLRGRTGGPLQKPDAPAELVARGRYLAQAADCAACHTAPGGAPCAGAWRCRAASAPSIRPISRPIPITASA